MKIVVTDGYTVNPGDLKWDAIAAHGELEIYDRTLPEQVMERCSNADIILTNKVAITKEVMQQCEKLKLISVLATGYNVIDTHAAGENAIIVCNVPAYGTASVAQHTFALLLELSNRVGLHASSVASGGWEKSEDWCYRLGPITELAKKKLGIVGFGHIGQQVAIIATAFGMQVLYYSSHNKGNQLATYTDLETLFSESDVVTLHCPLTADNRAFVNQRLLSRMKSTAFLINTARGLLIDEQDLADALNSQQIAGAAVDVLSHEPPLSANPLLLAKNCIITPHNAWMSREARERVIGITTQNINSFLQGQPINQVR